MPDEDDAAQPGDQPTKALTAADLLSPRPRRVVAVPVPSLGGVVYVRELNGLELDRLDDALRDDRGNVLSDHYRAKHVCACACDADGRPLFGLDRADVEAVSAAMLGAEMEAVVEEAVKLNRRRAADLAAAKKD
jgi:hypothetical protein